MIRNFALSALLALAPLHAAAFSQDEVLQAAILPGWRAADGTHIAALRLSLAPEWKTYWRSPGDAGIPPSFDWSGSENLSSARILWTRPHVFRVSGMQTFGYGGEVVLPIEVTAIDPTQPIRLRATIDLGICRDICVPAMLVLNADLPVTAGLSDPVIQAALGTRPITGAEAGLTGISCTVEPIADGVRVTAVLDLPSIGTPEVVVMEPGEAAVWVSEALSSRSAGRLSATSELVAISGKPFTLDQAGLRVTVLAADQAVEVLGCPAP